MKQSTSFAQVATNLLNVLQGYSKTIRLLLVMFLTLTVSANAWGAEITYTHAFTTKPSIGNNTLSNITWSVEASNLNNYNSGYAGVQFGTKNTSGSITLTSVNAWGEQASTSYTGYTNVKYVYVWLNAGSGTPTATVTIGGKAASKSGTVSKNTAANSNYENTSKLTFTPTSGGNTGVIVITASTSSKAGYIAAIEVVCETPAASCTTPPTVSSASNSNITSTTATVSCPNGITSLGSAGCSIESYGFVYGTSSNPTISNTKEQVGTTYTTTGTSFTKELTGLTANTTYYVRPYATNGNGTAYGTQTSFKTLELPKYTVTLVPGSGSVTNTELEEPNAGAGVTLPTPTLDCGDWEFAGWKTTSAVTTETTTEPTLIPAGAYSPTSDITLYAVYQRTEDGGGNSTPTSVTKVFSGANNADLKFTTGSSSNHLVNNTGYTAGDANVKFTTGTNNNNSYYDGSVVRFYAGSSMIITPLNGVTITRVEIVRSSSTSSNSGTISADNLTASNSNSTTNTNVFTGSSTTAVTFENSAQCRFTALNVTYTTSGGGSSTTYYHSTPDCGSTEPSLCLIQKEVAY